jgi:hypothetical protein
VYSIPRSILLLLYKNFLWSTFCQLY